MNCEEVEKKILQYAEGTLPNEEKEKMETHIRECVRCESFGSFLEVMGGTHSVGPGELSPQFWPKLHARILEYDAAQEKRGLETIPLWLRALLASTCLLLGVWAGIELGGAYTMRATALDPSASEDVTPYMEILGGPTPGSFSELFAREYHDERTEP